MKLSTHDVCQAGTQFTILKLQLCVSTSANCSILLYELEAFHSSLVGQTFSDEVTL